MRVQAADQAELERIRAERALMFDTALQALAHIVGRHHLLGKWSGQRQVAVIPARNTVADELVIRRQQRMAFRRALALHDLVDRFPARAAQRVVARQRRAGESVGREHPPVAEIGVVRDRHDLAAGLLFIVLHPGPELLRVFAVPR